MKCSIILTFVVLIFRSVTGQVSEMPVKTDLYPYVKYDEDNFIFCNDSLTYSDLFYRLDSIIMYGTGKLSIVHFGGSHIQADIYTDHMRKYMQSICKDCNAGRGLVTPYKIAHTNNPSNYAISYSGQWEYSSIVKSKKGYKYGVSGLSLYKKSKTATIDINPNKKDTGAYLFNQVKVFHNNVKGFEITAENTNIFFSVERDSVLGVTNLTFDSDVEDVSLKFESCDTIQDSVFVYGISLESESPGIIYHTVGINGASFRSYLKADLMPMQLKALDPDLIIISIGTNDANTRYFKEDIYAERYKTFLDGIIAECPNAMFLLTVPNDSKLYRKYVNYNTEKVKNEIIKLGCEYNCGIWDFYTIMGGLNSMEEWYKYGLARADHIHFNKKGYHFKGDLFFNAFLRAYNNHIHYINGQNENYKN